MPKLAETLLPGLLVELHAQAFSGTLLLRRGRDERRVTWQAGQPTRLHSTMREDGLAEQLAARDLLSDADRAKLDGALAKRPDADELALLAQLKCVAPKELIGALCQQLTRGLAACFAWRDADYEIEPAREAAPNGSPGVPLDVIDIVRAGLVEHWRPDQVLAGLGDCVTQYPVVEDALADARPRLGEHESVDALLTACDGSRSAWDALRAAPTPEAHAALWILSTLSLARFEAEPQSAPDAETAPEPEAEPEPSGPQIEILVVERDEDAADFRGAKEEADEGAGELDDKAVALRDEILGLYETLGERTHYELLGVEQDEAAGKIKRAYLKLAKRMHPDALARMGLEEIKAQANDVFAQIGRAYAVLSDPAERADYDGELAGHTKIDVSQIAQAEALFTKGEFMMRSGNFLGAFEFLDAAVQLYGEEADYQAALGWTLFKKNPPEETRAIECLEKAIELAPDYAQNHARLAVVYKAVGETEKAAAALKRGRALDPDAKA